MTTPIHDADPAAALAAIDDAQHRTARALHPSLLGMFLPWGLGYLVGFGGVWLAIRGVLPEGVVPALLVVAALVPSVGTGVTVARSTRGVSGPSRRVNALHAWTWLLGFAALVAIDVRTATLAALGPGDRLTFPRLQQLLEMTAGNLSTTSARWRRRATSR